MKAGDTKLSVETERQGDRCAARVTGDLDHDTAPALRTELEQASSDETVCHLDLDLSAVTFIDSAALQVFTSIHAALGERGGALHVTEASSVVARILDVTGFAEVFGT